MGENSKIAWTHHTFNPWWGCTKIDPACANCYAATFAKRTGHNIWGENAERRFFGDKHWAEPVKWNAAAEKAGERKRVFCASMADVFEEREDFESSHNLWVERGRLWRLIEATPHLDWLLLTKRPENIRTLVPEAWLETPRENVWYGTTAGEQTGAAKRVHILRSVPAKIRFLSCEPLLGPMTLDLDGIDWLIAGGESGPGARNMKMEWVQSLRMQCRDSGVKFFMKQLGQLTDGVKLSRDAIEDMDEFPAALRVREFPKGAS